MQTNAYGKRIRDSELLRRIKRARATQCLNDPLGEFHDPVEDAPDIKPILRAVERRAEKESLIVGMGNWGSGNISSHFALDGSSQPSSRFVLSTSF